MRPSSSNAAVRCAAAAGDRALGCHGRAPLLPGGDGTVRRAGMLCQVERAAEPSWGERRGDSYVAQEPQQGLQLRGAKQSERVRVPPVSLGAGTLLRKRLRAERNRAEQSGARWFRAEPRAALWAGSQRPLWAAGGAVPAPGPRLLSAGAESRRLPALKPVRKPTASSGVRLQS